MRLVLRYIGHAVRSASMPYIPPVGEDLENLAPGREFEIPVQGIVLGRYAAADVHVYSPYVKGQHVRLWPIEDGIAVEDQASTNGTAINGVLFSSGAKRTQAVLRRGDRLTLAGTHDFEVVER
jgi:hypothetical protein